MQQQEKFNKRRARQLAREEAKILLARDAAALAGGNVNKGANESANAVLVLKKPIPLSAHIIVSEPIRESAIVDSTATSSCCPSRAKLVRTGKQSNKIFEVPTGQVAVAGEERELPHNLQAPANICHDVPEMEQDTLWSVSKLVDTGYTPILAKEGVEVYNTSDIKFIVSKEAVLRGWNDDSGM